MATRNVLARLAAQAARADLGQVGAAGAAFADWTDSGLLSPPSVRQQQQQQHGFFQQGHTGTGPANAAALGATALPSLSTQQQPGNSANNNAPLPWLSSSGALQGWPDNSIPLAHNNQQFPNAQLMPPLAPALNLPEPFLKDGAQSHALLASFLTNAANAVAAQSQRAELCHRGSARMQGPSQGGAGRTRGSNSSIALNKEIMGSSSVDQLLAIVRAHGATFDFFNISTAVSRIPKLIDCSAVATHVNGSTSNSGTSAILDTSDGASARLADHGVSAPGPGHLSPAAKELSDRLCALVLQHLHEFDGRGLANTAWAFAKLRYVPDASLPAQLCRAAVEKIHQFAPQNVSNLAWALVYMHYQDPHLLQLLKEKACDQVYEMKPQELANIMWALASHEQLDVRTARILGERAAGMAAVFKEQELSNIIWAMGRGGQYEAHVLQPLLNAARNKLHSFMPQGVSNMVWALGQLGHRDEVLLHAVSRHCPATLHQYDSQALSNLATGLAALNWEGHGLLHAVATEAASRGTRMAGQHMMAVLAACASLGLHHDRLMAAVNELVQSRPGSLEPPALASLAWALSRLGPADSHVMEQLAAAIVSKIDRFSGQALVSVSMAFAEAGEVGHKVLQAVAARLPGSAHSLTPPQCMAVSWALMQAGAQTPEASASLLQQATSCGAATTQQQSSRALQLCSSLLAAAQAGQRVEPRMHASLLATARSCLPDMDAQQLASSCWALAVLGVLDVDTLNVYEASLSDLLGQPAGQNPVRPAEIKQMCEARAMVATQLAQRVGVPLTSLPQHIMPPMPSSLAAAVHATTAMSDSQHLLSLLGGVNNNYPGNQSNPLLGGGNNGYPASQPNALFGLGGVSSNNNPKAAVQDYAAGLPDFGMWGADVSALAVLAATQEAVAAQQKQASEVVQLSNLLNLQLGGNKINMQGMGHNNNGTNMAPSAWVQSVWNTGGLGNGLLGNDSTTGSPSNGSASEGREAGTSCFGGGNPEGPRSRRPSSGPANSRRQSGVIHVTADRNVLDSMPSLHLVPDVLLASNQSDVGEWAMPPRNYGGQGVRQESINLEDVGGMWLPKDLLAANGGAAAAVAAAQAYAHAPSA